MNRPVHVVISVGRADFGRCPIGSRRPVAFWPIAAKTALEHLLAGLALDGVDSVIICASQEHAETLGGMQFDGRIDVDYVYEDLPLGTAGCLRAVAEKSSHDLFVVMPANTVFPPAIDELLEAYTRDPVGLVVFNNPMMPDASGPAACANIFMCERSAVDCVPEAGFCDIKEGLIPLMLRAGMRVRQAGLSRDVGHFRDRASYLSVVEAYLASLEATESMEFTGHASSDTEQARTLIAAGADIHESASLHGPVMVMDGASIGRNSVILGPAAVGCNVRIDEGCVLSNSVIWPGASLARGCEVQRCIMEDYSKLEAFDRVEDLCVSAAPAANQTLGQGTTSLIWAKLKQVPHAAVWQVWGLGLILAAFVWSYWTGFCDLWRIWAGSDEYSSGLLVPLLALYVLYTRRADLARCPLRPCLGWGGLIFVGAQAVRLLGAFLMYASLERLSIVLSLYGLAILLFGLLLFRKTLSIHCFLLLMLPWPNSVQSRITIPLQEWATASAVTCLEMLRHNVVTAGNIIILGDTRVAVAEACNGLRMITAFFVITYLVVLLANRRRTQKIIILASSLPIALLCNTIRLTITSLIFTQVKGEHWEQVFHDFGGYAMMPLALGMVMLELWIMTKLTTPPLEEDVVLSRGRLQERTFQEGEA